MEKCLAPSSIGFFLSFVFHVLMLLYYLIYKILYFPLDVPLKFKSGKILLVKNLIDYNILWILLCKIYIFFTGFFLTLELKKLNEEDMTEFIPFYVTLMMYSSIYMVWRSRWRIIAVTTVIFIAAMSLFRCAMDALKVPMLAPMVLKLSYEVTNLFIKTKLPFKNSLKYYTSISKYSHLENPFNENGFDTSKVLCTHSHNFSAYKSMFEEFITIDIIYSIETVNEPLKYRSLVYHELGHIFYGHTMKTIFFKVIGNIIIIYLAVLMPFDKNIPVEIIKAYSHLSILETLFSYLLHLYSQYNEFQADTFSSNHVGTGEYLIESISDIITANETVALSAVHPPYFIFNTHPSLYHRYRNVEGLN